MNSNPQIENKLLDWARSFSQETALIDRMELNTLGWSVGDLGEKDFQGICKWFGAKFQSVRAGGWRRSGFRTAVNPFAACLVQLRYFRSQRVLYFDSVIDLNVTKALTLEIGNDSQADDREFSFDGKSNWLPSIPSDSNLARLQIVTSRIVHGCLLDTADLIQNCLNQFDLGAFTLNPGIVSIAMLELYWELAAASPIQVVAKLRPAMESYFIHHKTTGYKNKCFTTDRDRNSIVLVGFTHTGRSLKVYAKTNGRVRFEVTLGSRKIRERMETNVLRNECAEYLNSCIRKLAKDATPHFRRVIERTEASSLSHLPEFDQLAFEVAKACNTPKQAREVLALLRSQGCISSQAEYRSAIYKLKKAGLVSRTARGHYEVTSSNEK